MSDEASRSSVYVYEYGEAYDDLRPAFFIDVRDYADRELAESAVESAEAAMTRAGVIYEVEVTSGVHATRPAGVPTWEQFKKRHFVDGVPLPVRPRPAEVTVPPGWQSMIEAVEAAHRALRSELVDVLTEALPGRKVVVSSDRGPSRRSAGSIDWSEERFGFEIWCDAGLDGMPAAEALDSIGTVLARHGWTVTGPDHAKSEIRAARDLFSVWVEARPVKVVLLGESPLYSSPAEADAGFVVEAR